MYLASRGCLEASVFRMILKILFRDIVERTLSASTRFVVRKVREAASSDRMNLRLKAGRQISFMSQQRPRIQTASGLA